MLTIKDFTDEELQEQIRATSELLDIYEYGSGDYNVTKAELEIAVKEKYIRDIRAADAKDKLVLEYLNLSCEFMDAVTNWNRKAEIKIQLNEIRKILGMELLT